MSDWRDRGFVPDSDDDEITLSSPSTPTSSQPSVELPTSDQNASSLDHQENQVDETDGDVVKSPEARPTNEEKTEREGNQHQDVIMQDAGESLNGHGGQMDGIGGADSFEDGRGEDMAGKGHDQDDASASSKAVTEAEEIPLRTQAAPKKPQPIVLITQSRRPDSPPALNKNVRTYSRKFQPSASKPSGNNTPATENVPSHDDFQYMDVDDILNQAKDIGPLGSPEAVATTLRRSSVSSSDLSDVDMQILSSSPRHFFPRLSVNEQINRAVAVTRGPSPQLQDAVNGMPEHDLATLSAPMRNFRTRRAIQLHPYMIENEQYRRSLKARGIRPTHVIQHSQQPTEAQDPRDLEFRHEETQSQSQNASRTQDTTPPDSSASPHHSQRNDLRALIANDNEEFPDIDAALRRNVMGGIQEGFKRRKTIETPHNRSHLQLPSSSISGARGRLKSLNLSRKLSGTAHHDLLPLSPPRTSSPSNVDPTSTAPPRFRFPRGLTPVAVPTPLPSSPERAASTSTRRPRHIIVSSDDENENDGDAASHETSSTESDADDRQLLRMRRKIKGVLPASWLKLDRQARRPSPRPGPTGAHNEVPRPTAPVRGVAQRKPTSSSATPATQRGRITISDNEDVSDDSIQEIPAPRLVQTRLPSPTVGRSITFDEGFGEVEEHDEIDAMLPSTNRPRFRTSGGSKRQPRITDMFEDELGPGQAARPTQPRRTSEPSTSRKSRSKNHADSGPKKRTAKPKRPVQLSILDTTTYPIPQGQQQPQFVRLAARQARKRPDQGRHSPTNKNIRLATREDTQEAAEPLRAWRSGKLGPTSASLSSHRERYAQAPSAQSAASASGRSNAKGTRQPFRPARPDQAGLRPQSNNNREKRQNVLRTAQRNEMGSLQMNHRMRPAQLETVANANSRDLDLLTFAAPPSRLMEIFSRDRGAAPAARFRLERFLQDKEDLPGAVAPDQIDTRSGPKAGNASATATTGQRLRKRLARRLDVELTNYRQPDEPLPAEIPSVVVENTVPATEIQTLTGLGPFGTRYPTDFDVRPLEIGTYFALNTFVGSGDFDDCLTLRNRDLDVPAGRITIEVGGQYLHWSAWDEEVSTGLTTIFNTCTEELQAIAMTNNLSVRVDAIKDTSARFNYFLRSIVRYLSGCLHFIDPIDRPSCLSRISRFIDELTDVIEEQASSLGTLSNITTEVDRLFVDSLLFLLCLTAQSVRIARHPAVDSSVQALLLEKAIKLSRRIVLLAMPGHLIAVRTFLEEHRQHAKRDHGIQEDDIAVKIVVIVSHVLESIEAPSKFSDILVASLGRSVGSTCNIHALDQIWYDMFSVQPLLEIDARGIFKPKSRFRMSNDNWTLVRTLLQRTFDLYPATSKARSPTLNEYVRATLSRVYHFVVRWGWRRCEAALSTIYDFFARNNLSQLYKEESKGSPRFLEDIDKNPSMELNAGDCAFHIFLKLLVVGLRGMQEIYPKSKVRGFAWRFIPNHGRTYRKDQDLTQVALDALRNHHDLLCTLYWVLPPGSGPRVQMIKDLVDHDNSHREACRLSVHSWGILARYQLSQNEQPTDLDALASWFKEMVTVTISQYRLAKSEAEVQYALETARGSTDISTEMLETTIAANQRSILATLLDLLQAMRQALRIAKSWDAARALFELSNMLEVFRLFDNEQPRLSVAILQGIDVVEELLAVRSRLCIPFQRESQQGSDDSQEYGDWSFMDQVAEPVPLGVERKLSEIAFLQDPLANLLSTCFGSEKSPDDDILNKLVKVWIMTAHQCIKDGTHDWSNFLDAYSTLSWFQLRDTEQRHKYTALFLSSVIDTDKRSLDEHRNLFMKAWLVSLLDRESMLKYQHLLTASLLENALQEPLLHNLPFAANSGTGRYQVSLSDIRERRVSLIGTILSNMHTSLESAAFSGPSALQEVRRDYIDMLKHAMQYMRRTYEELQDMSGRLGTAHHGIQGAYVTFVQQTISLMQQYTSDICPVDPFFVDSSAFPLPANDPTYVVGRLKSYVSKLDTARARKQLAVFIQTVSERAAIDVQQPYLVSQLHEALSGERSSLLRQVMFTAILPAYLSCATSTECGWILTMPLIEASTLVVGDLIYVDNLSNSKALDVNIDIVTELLRVLHSWMTAAIQEPNGLLEAPALLRLLASVFDAVEAGLTFVEYVNRANGQGTDAAALVTSFVELGKHIDQLVSPPTSAVDDDADEPEDGIYLSPDPPIVNPVACPWQDTLDFCKRNLHDELSRSWSRRGGDYHVVRGNNVREVAVEIGTVQNEMQGLKNGLKRFNRQFAEVFREKLDADVEPEMVREMAELLWG